MDRRADSYPPDDDDKPTPRRRRRKPILVKITVRELSTDNVIKVHTADLNVPSRRRWLNRLLVWAYHQRKLVEVHGISHVEDCTEPGPNVALSDGVLRTLR